MPSAKPLLALTLAASAVSPGWHVEHVRTVAAPGGIAVVHETLARGEDRVDLDGVRFDAKAHTLRVVDNRDGKHPLPAALAAAGCVAGVNGGYFEPDRTPLGLVIADGRQVHPMQHASLLSGLVVAWPGRFALVRVHEFDPRSRPSQALQTGPFLVDGGRVVAGLEGTRWARRTAIATDGRGHGALIACDALTLADFARLLATPGALPGLSVRRALNLDGGSSTTFWTAHPPVYRPGAPDVRDFLGLAPRR